MSEHEARPGATPTVSVIGVEKPGAPPSDLPFRRIDVDEPAQIVLAQIDALNFRLLEGFRYRGPRGEWSVLPQHLPSTDLASIPRFMGWFVSRYGAHTLAALLHDHLVRNGADLTPPASRPLADEVFRDALDQLGVPYVRARIMWAAVTFATRWRSSWPARLALVAWMLAALAGIATLVWSVIAVRPLVVAAALLAPIPFALAWGRREYLAGLTGAYTLWLVALPAVVNVAAYAIYSGAERVVRRLRALRSPARVDDLPAPPSYSAR